MYRYFALLGVLLADAVPPQTTALPGRSAKQAVSVQGVAGGVAIPITGTISASSSCHATAAAPTYVEGSDSALSCDLAGTMRTSVAGGSSPSFAAAFPATGTAVGAKVVSATPVLVAGNMEAPELTTSGRIITDGSQVTQPVSGTVATTQSGTWTVQPGNTANTTAWKVDGSAVTQPVSVAATVTDQGAKTNNNAAPGATNIGALNALANAAVPAWTEGNLVAESSDLSGSIRSTPRPPVVTGAYRIQVTTAQYAGLTAGNILVSFRYTGTGLAVVTRVRLFVTTQTAATAAGRIDRGLFIVRSFTVADSGGTAVTLTSPVGKLRTSYAATGVGNLMVSSGGALTAGTGTQDANPVGVMAKAGTATEPIGLTLPAPGQDTDLFVYNVGQNLPIQLAQNEGLRITIPTAMPATIAMITSATFEWHELAAAANF